MQFLIDLLRRLYITGNYRGAHHLRVAIKLVRQDEDYLLHMGKLYSAIAFRAGCSTVSIERSIRTVILRAWTCNYPLLCEIAGHELTAPPTNSEFIEMLLYFVIRHEEADRAIG